MQSNSEQFNVSLAEAFKDPQVVNVYRFRPPYPDEVFDILTGLIVDEPRVVLDVGAGSGDIARRLVERVERVDAVDFSHTMIEKGKQLPGGNHPHLRWIYGKVEEVPLTPPYALITAGSSIHWMNWPLAFPRFRSLLSPRGFLALVYRRTLPMPWDAEFRQLRARYFTSNGHRGARVVAELETGGFFHKLGEKETAPVPFLQSIDDFIEGLHSRSTFSRERMGQQKAFEMDQLVRNILLRHHSDGMLPLQVVGTVIWGTPESGIA
ncbi:MAG TPA: class I SAM-dependent methyltransferase [Ktedonobacteraceae bacterium]|nr:class I SAM-dependent methyltransferase [Ktedonobacteraceae bacterium]